MTCFVASQLSTSHRFRIDAAKRDLGCVPTVSMREGLERLEAEAAAIFGLVRVRGCGYTAGLIPESAQSTQV